MCEIKITTEYIKLDAFLKLCGAVGTGGQAKMLIEQNAVTVGGEICVQRGRKLRPGDTISIGGDEYRVIRDDNP